LAGDEEGGDVEVVGGNDDDKEKALVTLENRLNCIHWEIIQGGPEFPRHFLLNSAKSREGLMVQKIH
jgi:hypothetical protein